MPKPSQIPTWATDPAAQITEPLNARKTLGWLPGDALPAQELNWILNRQGQWLDWLEKASRGAEVFTALEVAGSASVGGDLAVGDMLAVGSGAQQRLLIGEENSLSELKTGDGYSLLSGWQDGASSARYWFDPASRSVTIVGELATTSAPISAGARESVCDVPFAIRSTLAPSVPGWVGLGLVGAATLVPVALDFSGQRVYVTAPPGGIAALTPLRITLNYLM